LARHAERSVKGLVTMAEKSRIVPVILSGGAGTRLWPASREAYPKQFLPLLGERSTFEETLRRVADRVVFADPVVVTGEDFRFLVADQLARAGTAGRIVLEPMRRDSGPAIAVAAELIVRADPDAVMLVLAADHLVSDASAFAATAQAGLAAAEAGALVTFGIKPTHPATGYGYIRRGDALGPGVFTIAAFKEKPDHITALGMAHDDQFSWNSGMFLFSPRVLLEEFAPASDIRDTALEALRTSKRDGNRIILGAAYAHAPAAPLDTAVMEKTQRAAVAPCDIGWADIGAWDEIWRHAKLDDDGNATHGEVIALNAKNSVLHAEGVKICVSGIQDLIVIATKDAVIVLPRDRAQDVKRLKELAEKSSAPAAG